MLFPVVGVGLAEIKTVPSGYVSITVMLFTVYAAVLDTVTV